MEKITKQPAWQALQAHQQFIAIQQMQTWFECDPTRFSRFSLQVGEILLDYSKNLITPETLRLLINLAETARLPEKIHALFSGDLVNSTEKRAALHTALRNRSHHPIFVKDADIMPDIHATLEKIRQFSEKV